MRPTAALLSALLLAAPAAAQPEPPPGYEVYYRLAASVRHWRADTDLLAGGRLWMNTTDTSSGEIVLRLAEVLESPWKFYWIDPVGPYGTEVKVATVETLSEGTWEQLKAARERAGAFGRRTFESWLHGGQQAVEFNGTFSFVVIGPAQNRFEIRLDRSGEVAEVRNRLTDRWLNGPFDDHFRAWERQRPDDSKHGYWFWNQGEENPFPYEPHTYHALEVALRLLAGPTPDGDLIPTALSVIETLFPKAGGLTLPISDPSFSTSRTVRADGSVLERRLFRDERGEVAIQQDKIRRGHAPPSMRGTTVTVRRPQLRLELEVGYRRNPQGM